MDLLEKDLQECRQKGFLQGMWSKILHDMGGTFFVLIVDEEFKTVMEAFPSANSTMRIHRMLTVRGC